MLKKIPEKLNVFSSLIVAFATIALAFITYFQIDEARKMRLETKRLVDSGIEQFKIKSYPDLFIVLRPVSYESNRIIQVLEISNSGEITAFNVSHLLVHFYENNSGKLFVNLVNYKENGEIKSGLQIKFNLSRDRRKVLVKENFIPEKWTFDSLKKALLFIRFEVPYDTKYRYKTIGYQLKRDISAKEPGITYRWFEMGSNNTNFLIKAYMSSPSTKTDATYGDIKDFFRDYDLEYK